MTFREWTGQATTGIGAAAILTTVSAVLLGHLTWGMAIPPILGALYAMIHPENVGVSTASPTTKDSTP